MTSDELTADLAALRAGGALVGHAGDLLELTGPDRLRLLQGLVTADVKNLAPGATATGFFTSGQGRILADFRLACLAESCVLLLPSGTGETLRAHLEKYKVVSRVEISSVSEPRLSELRGPHAAGAAGAAADELARIEAGELRFGVDFSAENFPQETGREGDVSYTKGCYLGQEVVARIHYRGGVQRQPRGLRFTPGSLPAAGVELLLEGRGVGRATSVAQSPQFGTIGLGLLHQRGNAPGTRLAVAGGGEAEVVELPFLHR